MTHDETNELRENTKMTTKIYTFLTGNGDPGGGLMGAVDYIKKNMVIKSECESVRKTCVENRKAPGEHRRVVWIIIKDILLVLLAATGLLVGSGILFRS